MIAGTIGTWRRYTQLLPVAEAFKLLEDPATAEQKDGRYDLTNSRGIFYLVQRYTTIPQEEGALEAHMKYVDIQFIAKGIERIGYFPKHDAAIKEPYDAEKDIAFYEQAGSMKTIDLKTGMFAVFFPEDCHMPKLSADYQSEVTKVVVKIPLGVLRNY